MGGFRAWTAGVRVNEEEKGKGAKVRTEIVSQTFWEWPKSRPVLTTFDTDLSFEKRTFLGLDPLFSCEQFPELGLSYRSMIQRKFRHLCFL